MNSISVLILGAAYGMLPGVKLSLVGHTVTLVGRSEEIAAMAAGDLEVEMMDRHSDTPLKLVAPVSERPAPGRIALRTPDSVSVDEADFVILAMQEPQFAAPELRDLLARIAERRLPCLSIMNLPPLPFLARLPGIPASAVEGVYTDEAVWGGFDRTRFTSASPDAQAVRLDPSSPNRLTVTLASNFKVAPFEDAGAQDVLRRLAKDLSRLKMETSAGDLRTPVSMLAHSSPYIPLAKWPMLIAGNCRCITPNGIRNIRDAIHHDLRESEEIYQTVCGIVVECGVPAKHLVPFEQYASTALNLTRPSSMARALSGGAQNVERIDILIKNISEHYSMPSNYITHIKNYIDDILKSNRK